MSDLDDLIAAQFMMGPDEYVNHAWRERIKANPVKERPSQAWPYRPAAEVILLASRKKKT